MSIPCCVEVGTNRYECRNVVDVAQCYEMGGGNNKPGPEGTECYDPDTGAGCFKCGSTGFETAMNCCYKGRVYWPAEGSAFPFASNCSRCEGDAVANEEECDPSYPSPECREAGGDQPHTSLTRWTTDLIGTAAFGMSDEPGQNGESESEFDVVQPVTDHMVRNRPPEVNEGDSCAHVEGRYVVLEDGMMYVECCSQPSGGPDSSRYTFAALMTAEGEERLQDGCQYMMGGLHLPWWTEAILRSHQLRCGGWLD